MPYHASRLLKQLSTTKYMCTQITYKYEHIEGKRVGKHKNIKFNSCSIKNTKNSSLVQIIKNLNCEFGYLVVLKRKNVNKVRKVDNQIQCSLISFVVTKPSNSIKSHHFFLDKTFLIRQETFVFHSLP